MVDAFLPVIFLGVIALSLVLMAGTMAVTAWHARRVLRKIEAMLPSCDQTLRDMHQVLQHTRRLVRHGSTAAHRVEAVVQKTCEMAEDLMDRVIRLKHRAEEVVGSYFGNGAKAELRRHHRR